MHGYMMRFPSVRLYKINLSLMIGETVQTSQKITWFKSKEAKILGATLARKPYFLGAILNFCKCIIRCRYLTTESQKQLTGCFNFKFLGAFGAKCPGKAEHWPQAKIQQFIQHFTFIFQLSFLLITIAQRYISMLACDLM